MCSSCGGGRAARLRIQGSAPGNPIVLGEPNGQAAQPATFLVDHPNAKNGQYRCVSGDGVSQAVVDGLITLGYETRGGAASVGRRPKATDKSAPSFYVKTARNRWVGFHSRPAAERYATTVGAIVQTRNEVLAEQTGD